mgnify:CR=1 FL=1
MSIRVRELPDLPVKTHRLRFSTWPWFNLKWRSKSVTFVRVWIVKCGRWNGNKTVRINGCVCLNLKHWLIVCMRWVDYKVLSCRMVGNWDYRSPGRSWRSIRVHHLWKNMFDLSWFLEIFLNISYIQYNLY